MDLKIIEVAPKKSSLMRVRCSSCEATSTFKVDKLLAWIAELAPATYMRRVNEKKATITKGQLCTMYEYWIRRWTAEHPTEPYFFVRPVHQLYIKKKDAREPKK